nr:uncharacterized protein LOC109173929 [Ipomoea batatas]
MPKGLPPLRGIEHQFDFVPGGSTLPNRPAYKTNPIEAREIQKQVEELLEIGHIRESLTKKIQDEQRDYGNYNMVVIREYTSHVLESEKSLISEEEPKVDN